jgi:hypothetical protein
MRWFNARFSEGEAFAIGWVIAAIIGAIVGSQ